MKIANCVSAALPTSCGVSQSYVLVIDRYQRVKIANCFLAALQTSFGVSQSYVLGP